MITVSIKNSDNDLNYKQNFRCTNLFKEHHNQKCLYATVCKCPKLETKNTIYNQNLTQKCTLQKPARMRFCAFKYSKDHKKK